MLLHIRHGSCVYEVDVPRGCRVEPTANGRPVLLIPGDRPEDTYTWLPGPSIVEAARHGQFGLRLRGEQLLASRSA
jgi:hypothetical protein